MKKKKQEIAVNRSFSAIRSCTSIEQVRVAVRFATMATKGLPDRYFNLVILAARHKAAALGCLDVRKLVAG
jgi:hypothetical protein